MLAVYPTIYRDAHGEESTVIENDGQTLRMVVRGIEFISNPFGSFDMLTAQNVEAAGQAGFTLDSYADLLAGTLMFDMPLTVITDNQETTATLIVKLSLEGAGVNAADKPWADPDMILAYNGLRYVSRGGGGSFEGEMLQLQKQMPSNTYMKCCFNCAFSGYSPSGEGLWGMFCHRNHEEEYLKASDKSEWFRLNKLAAGRVQETYLCPEFQRWNGETGYRDPLHVKPIETQ